MGKIDTTKLTLDDGMAGLFDAMTDVEEMAVGTAPAFYDQFPISWITERSPVQTRAPFDPDQNEGDAELVESIKEQGVVLPIMVVVIDSDDEESQYRLIAGHRRVDGSLVAGQDTIRALVYPAATPDDVLDSLTFLENFHRSDPTAMETAMLVELLIERHGWTQDVAAKTLRIGVGTVNRYMALAKADSQIQTLATEGVIGLASAKKLSQVPNEKLPAAIDAITRRGLAVTDAVELAVQGDLRGSNEKDAAPKKSKKKQAVRQNEFVIAVLGEDQGARFYKALANDTYFSGLSLDAQCAVAILAKVGNGKWKATAQRYSNLNRASQRALVRCAAAIRKLYTIQKVRSDTDDAANILEALDAATSQLVLDVRGEE